MRRIRKDPFAREKRKRYRPSKAARVRTCVRHGICKGWLDSLNQDWLQSVLKTPEPKLTRIYPREDKANTAKLQRTSTLASQSLRACSSTRMEKLDDDLKGSDDQDQTTPDSDQFDTQEMQSQKTGIQSSYKEKYLETKAELSKAKEQIKELRKKYKDYQTTLHSDKFDTQVGMVLRAPGSP
ncbi:PREDICTED: uncharacterized protein LOC104730863 isoform X2 [Camelina sativa]|uniref:Uncharacterized protein LOC104730863 isoform X2 n=1 Tax=Camelina sativa TaxID=90675 RepID=A0ABM1QRC8_CAMSA|nr:PREDICTED: uncharacterized protein LOC104730863 isoform X2 [Camelina sativa]